LSQVLRVHAREVDQLTLGVYGRQALSSVGGVSRRATTGPNSAPARAERLDQQADAARAELVRVQAMPVTDAAIHIQERQEAVREAKEATRQPASVCPPASNDVTPGNYSLVVLV
jgi:hypothetical protein